MKRFVILFSLLFSIPPILLQSLPVFAQNLTLVPITPCRIIDTREPAAGGQLQRSVRRDFKVVGSSTDYSDQGGTPDGCGISGRAQAVAINLVAVNPAGSGNMQIWPSSQAQPTDPPASVINFSSLNPFPTIANGVVIPLGPTQEGDIAVLATQDVDLVADVYGFFTAFANVINVNELRSSNLDVDIRAQEDIDIMIDARNNSATLDNWTVYENGAFVNGNRLARIEEGTGDLYIRGEVKPGGLDLAELYRIDPSETSPIMPGHVVKFSTPDNVMLADATADSCRKVVGPVSTSPGIVLGEGTFLDPVALGAFGLAQNAASLSSALVAEFKQTVSSKATKKVPGNEPEILEEELKEAHLEAERTAVSIVVDENFVPVALEGKVPVKVKLIPLPSASSGSTDIVPGDLLYPGENGFAVKSPPPGTTATDCPSIGVAMQNFSGATGTSGVIMVLVK